MFLLMYVNTKKIPVKAIHKGHLYLIQQCLKQNTLTYCITLIFSNALYCILQHYTTVNCNAQHCTAVYSIALDSTALHSAAVSVLRGTKEDPVLYIVLENSRDVG